MQKFIRAFTTYSQPIIFYGTLSVIYLLTHLYNLTGLPVFADETIYIRWSQLIMDEPLRYLFFPLNDGKTPLYIWLLVPFHYLLSDPVLVARLISVAAGALQVYLSVLIVRKITNNRLAETIVALLTIVLPFWFFHHRMGLMDGLLASFITGAVYSALQIVHSTTRQKFWILMMAVSLGAALWTKLPAVLAFPSLFLLLFIRKDFSKRSSVLHFTSISIASIGGLALFALLRISPVFGQLFARGSDFLFPISDVLFNDVWKQTLPNIPTYLLYFSEYLSPAFLLLLVFGSTFKHKHRRSVVFLLLAGIAFLAPIALFGKVVYPRYLLPSLVFFTPAVALSLEAFIANVQVKAKLQLPYIAGLLLAIASILFTSLRFLLPSFFNPNATPFVPADRVQYLTEWSSGHGIKEATELIQTAAEETTIAVATEGFFGTLPDGILLYLHNQSVKNIWVEGIGQPVRGIPESFKKRAENYQTVWLVVNSHRLILSLPKEKLIQEYCRPYSAPCLQVWDITELVHTTSQTP